jgi:fumarate hydratase subunit beta
MNDTMEYIEISTPLKDDVVENLKVGQMVLLSGVIFTARDAAHKKMVEIFESGEPLSFDIEGQVVYYAGPCPAKPDKPIGSIGPTTSGRMDKYTPYLMNKGLKYMIGKGVRSTEVKECIIKHKGVYFAAIGGVAAVMAMCVKSAEIIAFDELGTEAIRKLVVEKLPLIVAIDCKGNDLYEIGVNEFSL